MRSEIKTKEFLSIHFENVNMRSEIKAKEFQSITADPSADQGRHVVAHNQ